MENEASLLLICLALLLVYLQRRRRRRHRLRRLQQRPRRLWSRQWLLRRELHGQYHTLLQELNREDRMGFKKYVRFTAPIYHEMLERIRPMLTKQTTRFRKPLSPGLKLAVTLRFLATGAEYSELEFNFRCSKCAICDFIPKVCKALIVAFKKEYLKCPTTPEAWKEVAQTFARRWNYHNCVGALDGKHVPMKKPVGGGSLYFNYKKFHSLILMALADAQLRFLYVDIGAEGGAGDAGCFVRTTLHDAINNGRIGFPEPEPLPQREDNIPYHIVGDDAFAMKSWLLKPFSHRSMVHHERVFNYRLSRARRVVENAFGVLQMRWRVFGRTQQCRPSVVKKVVLCACILHNMLMHRQPPAPHHVDRDDYLLNVIPGEWREEENLMAPLDPQHVGRNPSNDAKTARNYLAHHYASPEGALRYQDDRIYPAGRPMDLEPQENDEN